MVIFIVTVINVCSDNVLFLDFIYFYCFGSKAKIQFIHLFTTQCTRSKVFHIIDCTSNSLECSFLWLKGETSWESQTTLGQLK